MSKQEQDADRTATMKEAFHVAKLALFQARLVADIQTAPPGEVSDFAAACWARNCLSGPLDAVNQATFMQMSYVCIVWLWEHVKGTGWETHMEERLFTRDSLEYPPKESSRGPRSGASSAELLRTLRNAISHGTAQAQDAILDFEDKYPKTNPNWSGVQLTWDYVGRICERLIFVASDLLYAEAEASST